MEDEYLYRVVDALYAIAGDTGKTVPQIALNWLLQRPSVCSVIIGARNEEPLRDNLGAVGWSLTPEHGYGANRQTSATNLSIPTGGGGGGGGGGHQRGSASLARNPLPV